VIQGKEKEVRMQTLLLTGFEPFGGNASNPSEQVVQQITQEPSFNYVKGLILPVNAETAFPKLRKTIDLDPPQSIVMLGLYKGACGIRLERIGHNLLNFDIPDNDGNRISNQPIIQDGPTQLSATIPLEVIYETLINECIPVEYSDDAGQYLCNQVLYSTLHYIQNTRLPISVGFLHLPATPDLAVETVRTQEEKLPPSMDFTLIRKGIVRVLEILNRNHKESAAVSKNQ
jgi:pyroglutamyl-peptidase